MVGQTNSQIINLNNMSIKEKIQYLFKLSSPSECTVSLSNEKSIDAMLVDVIMKVDKMKKSLMDSSDGLFELIKEHVCE